MGGRDHSTALYAYEKVSDLIDTSDHMRRQVLKIRSQLTNHQPMQL